MIVALIFKVFKPRALRAFAATKAFLRRHDLWVVIGSLMALTLVIYLVPQTFSTIGPGQAGVLWYFVGGTDDERIFDEGTHLIFPWNEMYIYDLRIREAPLHVDVLSKDGLNIEVDVVVRYFLDREQLVKLHQHVGPAYLETIVLPEVGAAAREEIAESRPSDLYAASRRPIQDAILERVRREVPPRYVEVDDLLITSIRLPATVQKAIQAKLAQEQLMLELDYRIEKERKESERKAIEADGIARFQQVVAKGLTEPYLKWKGIDATLRLASSNNAKVVVIGGGENGLPLILGPSSFAEAVPAGPLAAEPSPREAGAPAAPGVDGAEESAPERVAVKGGDRK